MPADQHGSARKLPSGKWQLRYYDRREAPHRWRVPHEVGRARTTTATWSSRAQREAGRSSRPDLLRTRRGIPRAPRDRREAPHDHRAPLAAEAVRGEVRDDTARRARRDDGRDRGLRRHALERLRYPLMAAFRQALEAGIRYGYLTRNPAKIAGPNPMPAPREIRVYTPEELEAIVDGTRHARGGRGQVRGGNRPTACGVGLDGAERRRQGATASCSCAGRRRHARGERFRSPLGARSARRGPASARQPLRLHDDAEVPGTNEPGPFDVTTSAGASGGRRSTRPGSRSPRGSTTSARRSSRTRSRAG